MMSSLTRPGVVLDYFMTFNLPLKRCALFVYGFEKTGSSPPWESYYVDFIEVLSMVGAISLVFIFLLMCSLIRL